MPDEEYIETILDLAEQIPPGQVATYGDLATWAGWRLERGGPRQVGAVMAGYGGGVPWWRVVNARGEPPRRWLTAALEHLRAEQCPLTGDGRVVLSVARWAGPGQVEG